MVNWKSFMLTGKSFIKIWKMVYACFFRKPFSKSTPYTPLPSCSLSLSLSHHKTPLGSLELQTPLKYEHEFNSLTNHGNVRSCKAHDQVFFFFFPDLPDLLFGFDCCQFWVMVFPMMGLGVASGLKLMGFGWFWAGFLVLCSGSQWLAGWAFGRFWWGFDLWWVRVGCGGFVGWVVVVVVGFWSIPMVLGCGFYFYFYFYITPNIVKYLPEHFPKCNQILKKKEEKNSMRSFTFENNLHWKIFNEIKGA